MRKRPASRLSIGHCMTAACAPTPKVTVVTGLPVPEINL
jgi:hypothetical protein